MSDHPDPDAAVRRSAAELAAHVGFTMEDAARGAEAVAEVIRNDPTLPAHLAMLDAELQHRGMQGPRPKRWWKRARWVLWGRRRRRRRLESPACDLP